MAETNNCPRCGNDLSKECVVFVFAFHNQQGILVYSNPGDSTPILGCPCGAWVDENNELLNSAEV